MWLMRRAAVVCAALAALPVILFVVGAVLGEIAGCSKGAVEDTISCTMSGKLMFLSIPGFMLLAVPALFVLVGWVIAEIVAAWRS